MSRAPDVSVLLTPPAPADRDFVARQADPAGSSFRGAGPALVMLHHPRRRTSSHAASRRAGCERLRLLPGKDVGRRLAAEEPVRQLDDLLTRVAVEPVSPQIRRDLERRPVPDGSTVGADGYLPACACCAHVASRQLKDRATSTPQHEPRFLPPSA